MLDPQESEALVQLAVLFVRDEVDGLEGGDPLRDRLQAIPQLREAPVGLVGQPERVRLHLEAAPGIGLAAVQVGVPIRLLVIDLQEPENPDDPKSLVVKDPRVFINPEILWHSDTEVPYTEGCLSVPEQYAEVMRPDRIRARWRDSDGNSYEEEIDGLLAVCLQHEMDHLEGILFIDHLSRLKRDMVLKKLAKWRKEQGLKAA